MPGSAPASAYKRQRSYTPPQHEREVGAGCAEEANERRTTAEVEEDRPAKRRRGLLGTVLATAMDAAMLATAAGYSAWREWRDPSLRSDADVEELVERRTRAAHALTGVSLHPPSPSATPPLPSTPARAPRQVQHIHPHQPRPRAVSRPLLHKAPARSSASGDNSPEDDTFDDDPEMRILAQRMRALISDGREALHFTPERAETGAPRARDYAQDSPSGLQHRHASPARRTPTATLPSSAFTFSAPSSSAYSPSPFSTFSHRTTHTATTTPSSSSAFPPTPPRPHFSSSASPAAEQFERLLARSKRGRRNSAAGAGAEGG